jgi:hypothetical protein
MKYGYPIFSIGYLTGYVKTVARRTRPTNLRGVEMSRLNRRQHDHWHVDGECRDDPANPSNVASLATDRSHGL